MNRFSKIIINIVSIIIIITLFGCTSAHRPDDPFDGLISFFNVGPPTGVMVFDLKKKEILTTKWSKYDRSYIVYNCNLPLYLISKCENDNRLELTQDQLIPSNENRSELIELLGGLETVNLKIENLGCKNTRFGYDYLNNSTDVYQNEIPSDMHFDVTTAEEIMQLLQKLSLSELQQISLDPKDYNISVPNGAALYAQFGKAEGKDYNLAMYGRVKGEKSDFLIVILTMGAGNPSSVVSEVLETAYTNMEKVSK